MGRENYTIRLTEVLKSGERPTYMMVSHIVTLTPVEGGTEILTSKSTILVKESAAMILQIASRSGVISELK